MAADTSSSGHTVKKLLLPIFLSACGDSTLFFEDGNNYSLAVDVDAPSTPVASGQDIRLCWDQVSQDLQCHELEPDDDIDIVTVMRLANVTEQELEAQMATDTMDGSTLSGVFFYEPSAGETCAQLEAFSLDGTAVSVEEQFYEGGGLYVLLAGRGSVPGEGTVAVEFLAPQTSSDQTEHSMGSACGILDVEADLSSLQPVGLPAEADSWVVDWGNLSTNGQGLPLALGKVDRLMLGHYPDMAVADLEQGFMDLEIVSDELWYLDLPGGFSADLAQAQGVDGDFAGFDDGGVWLLALFNTHGVSPAPLFLTVIEPE